MNTTTLGVLLCDHAAAERVHIAGDYPEMFARMFRDHPEVRLRFYEVTAGEYPATLDECDAYVSTGYSGSVNDADAWISQFENFVRSLHDEQVRLVAICFGHQMIGKAMGGQVAVAEQGWGVGVHQATIMNQEAWMLPAANSFRIVCSHQEQITELPPGAVVLASTPHCPVAMLRCGSLVGIQGHPEFPREYAEALLESRASIIPESICAAATASFGTQPDQALLASWIVSYAG